MRTVFAGLALSLLGVACSCPPGASTDGGGSADGNATRDSGGSLDGGAPDSGAVSDGGSPPCAADAGPCTGRYAAYELTFSHASGGLANPWDDVTVSVTFTAPSARTFSVGGFFHDVNTWKARVAPDELGAWSWAATLTDPTQGGASF